jgi:Transposase, Mutator family
MTDVTIEKGQDGVELSAADEQLIRELTDRARTEGLRLTGEGGLLGKLTKMVIEGALEGELDDHLGYSKHDPAGRDGGNSRNGYRDKTVITEAGPVEISVNSAPGDPVTSKVTTPFPAAVTRTAPPRAMTEGRTLRFSAAVTCAARPVTGQPPRWRVLLAPGRGPRRLGVC